MARYTLAQVFEGRRPPVCVRDSVTVGEAMRVLLANHVSQAPVVGEDGGLRGVIAQQTILGFYFHTGGAADLLSLPVWHCLEPATALSMEDDLLDAVDQLQARGVAAVVATEAGKPAGILTGKDMTLFFHSLFEGLLMVEQIEVTLRQCVERAYPDAESRRRALIAAFGPDRRSPNRPARGDAYLTFSDLLILVTDDDNWPVFDPFLGPKALFDPLLDRARLVRNQLSHFRGRPDALGMDVLRRTVLWLSNQSVASAVNNAGGPPLPDVRLHPLSEVLAGRKPPLTVTRQASVGDALRVMTEHRFGQVPVVDEPGNLLGMVSQQGILGLYFHTDGKSALLELPVHHVMETALRLDVADHLYLAVDRLSVPGAYAAVVTEGGQPVAILTGKDMSSFFRSLFEGIILVEEIELLLRGYVDKAFPDDESLTTAAIAAFGADPDNPKWARRNPNKLSFGDELLMMVDDDNWPRFEAVLGPRPVFSALMERVRQVRNQLLHFSGQLDPLEHDGLLRTYAWLQNRPPWPDAPEDASATAAAQRASGDPAAPGTEPSLSPGTPGSQ